MLSTMDFEFKEGDRVEYNGPRANVPHGWKGTVTQPGGRTLDRLNGEHWSSDPRVAVHWDEPGGFQSHYKAENLVKIVDAKPEAVKVVALCADCGVELPANPDHFYIEGQPGGMIALYCDTCGQERGLQRHDNQAERKAELQ